MTDPVVIRIQAEVADALKDVLKLRDNFLKFRSDYEAAAQELNRVVANISGDKLVRQSEQLVAAVAKFGGVANLTERQLRASNRVVDEAVEKYEAMGRAVPAALSKLQAELRQYITELDRVQAETKETAREQAKLDEVFNKLSNDVNKANVERLATAIQAVGGVSALSTAEIKKFSAAFGEYFEKAERLGTESDQISSEVREVADALNTEVRALKEVTDETNRYNREVNQLVSAFGGQGLEQRVEALNNTLGRQVDVSKLSGDQLDRLAKQILETTDAADRMGVEVGENLRGYEAWAREHVEMAEASRRFEAQLKQEADAMNRVRASFGGEEVIRNANRMVAAVQELGGRTRLTRREQDSLNSALQEAIAKYRALGDRAPRDMLELEAATRRAEHATRSLRSEIVQGFTIGQMSLGYFIGSTLERALFGALRMVKDAIQDVINGVIELGNRGSEVARIQQGFEKLTVAASQAPAAIVQAGRVGLKGLVSDFDIMESANRAMLLGLRMTEKDFTTLTRSALVLGRAMNLGPAKALSDLVLALGRTSPRILDNLGIIVKIKDANEKYAASVGKTTRQLSAEERTLAFATEALRKMEVELNKLGEIQLTFTDHVTRMRVQWTNFRDEMAVSIALSPALNRMMVDLGNAIATAFGGDKFERIRTMTKWVDNFAIAMVDVALIISEKARVILLSITTMAAGVAETLERVIQRVHEQFELIAGISRMAMGMGGMVGEMFTIPAALATGFATSLGKAQTSAHDLKLEILELGAKGTKALADFQEQAGKTRARMEFASKQGVQYNDIVKELERRLKEAMEQLQNLGGETEKNDNLLKRFVGTIKQITGELSRINLDDPKMMAFVVEEYGKKVVDIIDKAKALGVETSAVMQRVYTAFKAAEFDKDFLKQMDVIRKSVELSNAAIIKSHENKDKKVLDSMNRTFEAWERNIRDIQALEEQLEPRSLAERIADIEAESQAELRANRFKLEQLRNQEIAIGEEVSYATILFLEQTYAEEEELIKRKTELRVRAAKEEAAEVIAEYRREALTIQNVLTDALSDLPKQLQSALTGGGGVMGAIKSTLSKVGAGLGEMLFTGPVGNKVVGGVMSLFGQNVATALGMAMPVIGAAIGALAGPLLDKIVSLFQKPGYKDVMRRVGRDWGVEITEELAKKIDETAKKVFGNNRQAAEIFHFKDIIAAAGGLNELNFDKFAGKLRDAFSMLETGKFTVEQTRKVLDDNFGAFAEHIRKSERIASESFLELIRLNQQFKTESASVREFLTAETKRAGEGLAGILAGITDKLQDSGERLGELQDQLKEFRFDDLDGDVRGLLGNVDAARNTVLQLTRDGKVGTDEYKAALDRLNRAMGELRDSSRELYDIQAEITGILQQQAAGAREYGDDLERVGRLTLATFNAAVAGGASTIDALTNVSPALDQLIALYNQLGLNVENAALQELMRYRELVTQNAGLVAAADALNQTMLAMSNIGALNAETLADLEAQGLDTFNNLTAAGFTETQALQVMRGWLQNVYDAHMQLGIPIDENTQKLIDQAEEAGILETKQQSLADVMKTGLGEIIRLLGGKLPEAWDTAARAAEASGRRIQGVTQGVTDGLGEMVGGLDPRHWDEWANTAVEAAMRAKEAVDTVTYGASPGGLVDIDRHLISVGKRFYDTSRAASEAMASVYNQTVAVKDALGATSGTYDVSGTLNSAARSSAPAVAASPTAESPVLNFSVQTFDQTDMLRGVENKILPLIIDALRSNRAGSLTQLKQLMAT